MNVLEGTDLGIFSVSKAENQAVQTERVCFVERIQQEAVQFFQGWVLYHKGALRNVGLVIASANHLAYDGTPVKPGFLWLPRADACPEQTAASRNRRMMHPRRWM